MNARAHVVGPENTAVRVALWRALHKEVDDAPAVLDDDVGLRLAAPDPGWRARGDMHPEGTKPFRASIVARARFLEDLVAVTDAQYVVLGAGLDTFAQRHPDLGAQRTVFEIDQPGPQAWKRRRLEELGFGVPPWLHLVPVDFEAGDDWWQRLTGAGFDTARPAVVSSTGVSMYLTKEATAQTLAKLTQLAPGSTVAMTFLLPLDRVDAAVKPGLERSMQGAASQGTPFISFYAPDEILALARAAGFDDVEHVKATVLADRYFAGRRDGLYPPRGEELLLARTPPVRR